MNDEFQLLLNALTENDKSVIYLIYALMFILREKGVLNDNDFEALRLYAEEQSERQRQNHERLQGTPLDLFVEIVEQRNSSSPDNNIKDILKVIEGGLDEI